MSRSILAFFLALICALQSPRPWLASHHLLPHSLFERFHPHRTAAYHTASYRPNRHWHHTTVLATAYLVANNQDDVRPCPVYSGLTASGTRVHYGTVAVDTGIFPFGTHFNIPGYGFGRARDTGGFINGPHIDLAVLSCKQAHLWGARRITIAYALPTPSSPASHPGTRYQ